MRSLQRVGYDLIQSNTNENVLGRNKKKVCIKCIIMSCIERIAIPIGSDLLELSHYRED